MHNAPQPPGGRTPELDESKIRDRGLAADRCKTAAMAIREWCGTREPFYLRANHACDVSATLLGSGRESGNRLPIPRDAMRGVACNEHIGQSRDA